MTSETRDAIGFVTLAAAVSALFLMATSCDKNMERERTKRDVACIQAGGDVVGANCIRSQP